MYKLSVILNVEHDEDLLLEYLMELTKQSISFKNLEVLLIGDNSVDWKSIEGFSKDYNNIYCTKITDASSKNYRNIAIQNSTAPYIMFLDFTNILFHDSCETLYDIINGNNCDIVSGNFIYEQNNDFEINPWDDIPLINGFYEFNNISEKLNILELPSSISTKIFNKNFLIENNIEFINTNSIEDFIFVTQSLQKANKIIFFNKPLLKVLSEKNEFFYRYMENKSIFKIINDLEWCYSNGGCNFKFVLNYVEDLFKFIISKNFSLDYLLDICVKMNFLVNEYVLNNGSPSQKEIGVLFNLIQEKRYDFAIKLIKLLQDRNNFKPEFIESKDIILLFYGFDYDIGGLAKAVCNRANLLSSKGLNVTLINTDPYTTSFIGEIYENISHIEERYRNLEYIDDNVKFFNLFEYYKEKNTDAVNIIEKSELSIDLSKNMQIVENFIVQKVKDEHGLKAFNYHKLIDFTENELKSIKVLFQDPCPENIYEKINFMKDFKKNIVKTEYYVGDSLFIESIRNSLNQLIQENLYTADGFNYFKIEKIDNEFRYVLFSNISKSKIIFKNYKEFCDYFVNEMCLNFDEKPFLINDCSGPIPSFNNVPHDLAYKIANIHSNPYLEPTYCYGSPRRVMSALKCVDKLDALVALTETEKNDFIKEFEIDNIFAIPNLIDFTDIVRLNDRDFEVDKYKLSIFARISPEKNLEDLIHALKIVIAKHPSAVLNIYGRAFTPGEKLAYDNLVNLINELNLEGNVIFRGHVDNAYDEMRTSLVTFLVSHIEGLPMVIIESMANKTPVISYDINYGPKDVIENNIDGFIVEKYNVEELAEKIIYLIDNPEIAIQMGEKAQENIFAKFELNNIYEKWLNVFKEAYFNAGFTDFCNSLNSETYINQTEEIKEGIEKTNIQLNNRRQVLKDYMTQIENKLMQNNKQNEVIMEQDNIIKEQNVEIENKRFEIENQFYKLRNLEDKLDLTKQAIDNEFDEIISYDKVTNEYYKLKSNPKKRVLLFLPYLYILFKHKNVLENIKFYRKIVDDDWFDIGYYLESNSDLSRKKWCKILTPQTHYTCHGFNEKRLPHPNYEDNLTKEEIIKKGKE